MNSTEDNGDQREGRNGYQRYLDLTSFPTLPSAKMKVTMEIEVEIPEGVPEDVQRTVSENAGVLKFDLHSFELE
jgi:hypothetical protein